ncbi:MAG TPA: hypothetical protein PLG27_05705, partial [Candidatus Latescibacteria bacterium]|nr:hypothetical protein [Candidatus Latescibacterota bacterium]
SGNIRPIPSRGGRAMTNIGDTIAPKPPPKPVFESPMANAARTVMMSECDRADSLVQGETRKFNTTPSPATDTGTPDASVENTV